MKIETASSFLPSVLIIVALLAPVSGCTFKATRQGIPPEVEATIGTVSQDLAEQRYEKIYNEASDLWREAATLEQSTASLKTLETKLGKVENRTLYSAAEQHNSGGPLKGRAFVISYQTKFERGDGMETFTLVERDNKWLLARYFVNSMALQ
jgi:hypothetical protein